MLVFNLISLLLIFSPSPRLPFQPLGLSLGIFLLFWIGKVVSLETKGWKGTVRKKIKFVCGNPLKSKNVYWRPSGPLEKGKLFSDIFIYDTALQGLALRGPCPAFSWKLKSKPDPDSASEFLLPIQAVTSSTSLYRDGLLIGWNNGASSHKVPFLGSPCHNCDRLALCHT